MQDRHNQVAILLFKSPNRSIMKYLLSFTLVLVMLTLPSCKVNTFKTEMVKLDQAYVPLFTSVHFKDQANANKAVFRLAFQWQQFQNKYKDAIAQNENWAESFRNTDCWLNDAFTAVNCAEWDLAYVQLDHVRYELMQIRRLYEMPYYLDYLWDFQMAMDMVLTTIENPDVCEQEWTHFEVIMQEMNDNWRIVEDYQPEVLIYGWDSEKYAAFKQKRKEFATYLQQFNHQYVSCSEEARYYAIDYEELEPRLFELIAFFGDFNALESYYAKR